MCQTGARGNQLHLQVKEKEREAEAEAEVEIEGEERETGQIQGIVRNVSQFSC